MTETFIISLPRLLRDCPTYWKNFIHECDARVKQSGMDQDKVFDNLCLEYNLSFEEELVGNSIDDGDTECWLEFKDEESLMWFKLRWL